IAEGAFGPVHRGRADAGAMRTHPGHAPPRAPRADRPPGGRAEAGTHGSADGAGRRRRPPAAAADVGPVRPGPLGDRPYPPAPAAQPRASGPHRGSLASLMIRARTGRSPAGPAGAAAGWAARLDARPASATGSTRSAGVQPKMSHNAASVRSDSRSGTPVTSR